MPSATPPEVLVVGAGPTGLTMAGELARYGVASRIIDQAPFPTDKSKAMGVHSRTLEIFDTMGIATRAVEAGRALHGANFYSQAKRIAHVGFEDNDTPFPFILSIPQAETERILTEHLQSQGLAVERSAKLTALQADQQGATATVSRDGVDEQARFGWVIGCDGAHSAVRKALGLVFEGLQYEEAFAVADVAMDGPLPDDETHVFLSPEGVCAVLPLPGHRRCRVLAEAPPDQEPTFEWTQAIFRERANMAITLSDPHWISLFRIHRRMVRSYREGRVFLAGDAAHIHSPMGGQGMNTGIQDAANLAWKLALVMSGKGAPSLLDTYDAERRPIAASTLENTDFATRAVTLRSPIAREIRNRLMSLLTSLEAVQRRIARDASQIGLNYRRSPIVLEERLPIVSASVTADRTSEDPSLADWLDFGAGPRAGDRAPDCLFDEHNDKGRLFGLLHPTKHTLLLFDGAAATAEGYINLASIAARVREAHGDNVAVHVVVPRPAKPRELGDEQAVVLDVRGELHRRYGAGSECLYLIRPDGYIAYRAQPADAGRLVAFFARVFR